MNYAIFFVGGLICGGVLGAVALLLLSILVAASRSDSEP